MFDLIQLRCFIAVADERHFGRAAERLHMSQPPLSRQIQQLERDLGVILVARTNRVAALTPAGETFLADARRLVRLADEARRSVARVATGAQGSLAIGFTSASSYAFVPKLVALTSAELPALQIQLRELITGAQVEALEARRLDVGFLRLPVDRTRMDAVCVARERMVLALPEAHPLLAFDGVALAQLNDFPFVMFSPEDSRYHHGLLAGALAEADAHPRFVQYARETHTILGLVGAGVGLAVVPESALRLRPPNVEVRPLVTTRRLVSELHMVWRRDIENPALEGFERMVRFHFADL